MSRINKPTVGTVILSSMLSIRSTSEQTIPARIPANTKSNDNILTAKIAISHLNEKPDYYKVGKISR
jgi:hypothetical protein